MIYTPAMALVNHLNIGTAIDLTSADTTLNMLPQFHTGGINLYALPTLFAGGTAIVQQSFRPEDTLQLLAWALMGVGEIIGMRWILWGDTSRVPAEVFEEALGFVLRGLGTTANKEADRPSR